MVIGELHKHNPFTPDMPVPPHLFGGRVNEVRQIEHALDEALGGNALHLLVQGERWIGKTSTARYAEARALMRQAVPSVRKTPFYTSFCSLGSCSTLEDVCVTILDSFKRMENSTKNRIFELLSEVSGIQVGLVGITLDRTGGGAFRASEFARILEESLRKATDSYQAFLLVLDETEQAADIPRLGSLLKDTLEHLNRVGIRNFTLLMTATREGVDALTNDHLSFPRLFRYVNLAAMNEDECREAVLHALGTVSPPLELEDLAGHVIYEYSRGVPGLVQEMGYWAFEVNTDSRLGFDDLIRGVVGGGGHKGAIETIFDKHFRRTLTADLVSDRYFTLLQAAAEAIRPKFNGEFSSQDIAAKLPAGTRWNISPYLGTLVKRGVLTRAVGQRGRYRFPTSMLPLWIGLHGVERAKSR